MRTRLLLSVALLVTGASDSAMTQTVTKYVRYSQGTTTSYGILDGAEIRELRGDLFANPQPTGKRVKLDFGSEGVVLLDGAGQQVSEEDAEADTTIKVDWNDWQQMAAGQLDGMTAFMTGKLKIEGDMGVAMKLQSILR